MDASLDKKTGPRVSVEWKITLMALGVIGLALAVGFPLITGNPVLVWLGVLILIVTIALTVQQFRRDS